MKAVIFCLFAALAASKLTSIPWPVGFKYPSSYVSKWASMVKTGDFYKPDLSTLQVMYVDADNQKDLVYDEGQSTFEDNA